ncbi:hypothetical protein BCY84_02240 [Trypanosoma cruzi cruzi]|nr:putative Methyltransferase TRM13 [Trypanosoma cruzi]PBJ79822.1 hypothetical protein BCY84_02240 [Trypanosoma cruzi cruzi]PWU94010.1 hypothetical protein C4B63_28g82 [Trypanosoma cruzi]
MQCSLRVRSHTLVKCRRKQYHGTRAALQFVTPLLVDALHAASSSPLDVRRKELASALVGVPPSLSHEGPLACSHLQALAGLCEGDLLRLLSETFSDVLEAPPTSHVAEMWSSSLQETYVRELARARAAESNRSFPRRFEAGMTAHHVFSGAIKDACAFGREEQIRREEDVEQVGAGRWSQLIDDYTLMLPDRSPLHELENLPQEIGIGELLASLLSWMGDEKEEIQTIMDVGGGNGFLAAQLAEIFRCESIVVDPFTPKHAIDSGDFPHWVEPSRRRPRVPRQHSLCRIRQRLTDVNWKSTPLDFNRCTMIAKHLCGTAIDTCIHHLQFVDRLPRIMVLVPCCFNKGNFVEYCNPVYLHSAAGVKTEMAWNRWTRLTDWNRSSHQQFTASTRPVKCCSDSVKMGHRKMKKLQHFLPCMDDIAFMAEAVINHGRVLWLRQLGYHALTVSYVPRCVTPKNRAIVAIRDIKPVAQHLQKGM